MFKKRKYKMCSLPYITILLILHGNNHVFENSLINIEKKLCQNILHKEMLLRTKC